MMSAFQRLFQNGSATSTLSDEVEVAVNGLVREAEELWGLLRSRRELRKRRTETRPTDTDG
jgi:hypothetical protein